MSAKRVESKKICAYCKKPIKKGEYYVLYDAYNRKRKHKKYFHATNGERFLDTCFMRYNEPVPRGHRVELKVSDEGWYGTYFFWFVKERVNAGE